MGIMKIVLLFLCVYCGHVGSQSVSIFAVECYNTNECPCCSVPCPSDGSGQCGGDCKDGYHGGKCYNRCPYNCIRCVDALQGGANCTLCKDGYYSTATLYQCQSNCSSNCKTCSKHALNCDSCNEGFFLTDSSQCTECKAPCLTCTDENTCTSCKAGYYYNGTCQKCKMYCNACNSSATCFCSNGCSSGGQEYSPCDIETNTCKYGCRDNFQSTKYNNTCDGCTYGRYGYECNLKCNNNCNPKYCDRETGACYGCENTLFGDFCNLSCPINCKDRCDQTYGHCLDCKDGFFGINCTLKCNANCQKCNITNGLCILCNDGWYGENCDQTCFINCENGACNHINGNCTCAQGYTGPRCEDRILTTVTVPNLQFVVTEEPNKHVGPTVGITLAGVVVVGSVAVAALVLYRRRRAFRYVRYDIDFDSYKLDARSIDVLEENDEFDPTYFTGKVDDTNKPCGKLSVKELAQFIETHGEDFYQEEFLKLPRGLIKPCDDAKKEKNVVKNRYTGIYPYDENRVRLQPPGSDFINACYMDGYKRKHEYIASLGPTRKAMEGFQLFWRMVWQEKTDVIVMVTNLIVGQSMKCEQYWPDIGTSSTYGLITVTSQTEDTYAEFIVRTLTIAKGKEERTLHHLHYSAWPDKRVPDNVTSLIEFRQKVKATGSKLGGPTIVHCSAGIGPTGTYIALDILIHQGKAEKSLDVFECVSRMREQRTSMVQTWPQYEYLHRALLHALTYHCEPVKQNKIEQFMERLNDKKVVALFKQLDKKYEQAPGTREGEREVRGVNKGLEGMNREGTDIPGVMHRPFLPFDNKFRENNYTNALFLNSYTVKNRFLVCQTPLPDTVNDFLTLITQESCSCIISMDPPGLTDPTIGNYYPDKSGTMFSDPSYLFDVEAQDLGTNPSYNLRRLTIHCNTRSRTTEVYHFQCQHWPQGVQVPDVLHFLQLIQDVENMANRNSDRGPILVHCLNAATRSGLFCTVSNLVQKMRMEGAVSVVNTISQVKIRRPLAVPNKEQYMFCYRCLHQFVKSQNANNKEAVDGNID